MRLAALILILGLVGCHSQRAGIAGGKSADQVRPRDIDEAIRDGVAYLVKSQNPDGSWGTGTETRGFEVYSMVPGTHHALQIATTALCVMALREAGETAAHDRGVEYLISNGDSRRDKPDLIYNIWAHIYALQALSQEIQVLKQAGLPAERLESAARWQLDRLIRYETYVGGWNYYDFEVGTQVPAMEPTSFGTAAGLVALHEARKAGIEVPQGLIDRALRRLAEMRLGNGAFLYSGDSKYIPRMPANQPRGSVGRTQSCNYALLLWQARGTTRPTVIEGLDFFTNERQWMGFGRKRPMPHESWYQTAAYYYYFGHYYTARLIELLGEDDRAKYREMVAAGVLPYQEPDGSWWDYAMWDFHKPYGTAYAVMTLARCK